MTLAVSETLLLAELALQAQTMKLAGFPGATSPPDGYGLTRTQSCGVGGGELDVALGVGLGLVLVGVGLGLVVVGLGLVVVAVGLALGLVDGEVVADVLLEPVGLLAGLVSFVGLAVGVVGLAVGVAGVVGSAVGVVVWLGGAVPGDAAADDGRLGELVEPGAVLVGGSAPVGELGAADVEGGDAHTEFAVPVAACTASVPKSSIPAPSTANPRIAPSATGLRSSALTDGTSLQLAVRRHMARRSPSTQYSRMTRDLQMSRASLQGFTIVSFRTSWLSPSKTMVACAAPALALRNRLRRL